ncbi:MAG: metallophosphoesterase [Desulfobacteraceae bacterium]|nr:metallophosphoesterase [Desulfobacteraceae bacterium]MBC2752303.1 metallophosphoesterase family protein [Desulfobacteraceae bacterium]
MRLALLSDIHSNLEALEAVLENARDRGVHRYTCLGDLVGYGANPNECIEVMRSLPKINFILGNHDAAATWRSSPYIMNKAAADAILWTMDQLTDDNVKFLKHLPPTVGMGNLLFAHANPYNPLAWRYVNSRKYAARSFNSNNAKLVFIGHTHLPEVINKRGWFQIRFEPCSDNRTLSIGRAGRMIVNCGSIGQPRDKNPAACYLIYDTRRETIEFVRVPYNHERAARKIQDAGLPGIMARRLAKGR